MVACMAAITVKRYPVDITVILDVSSIQSPATSVIGCCCWLTVLCFYGFISLVMRYFAEIENQREEKSVTITFNGFH